MRVAKTKAPLFGGAPFSVSSALLCGFFQMLRADLVIMPLVQPGQLVYVVPEQQGGAFHNINI